MRVIPSICTFCGVGCGIGLRVENGRVIGVEPQLGHPVSQGQLCSKGWSSSFAIDSANRLTDPLIKEHGRFRRASWDEALELVAEAFRTALDEVGPQSVGVISCARASNEDNYAAQKFARAVLGTHNIDHCARICHSPSVAGLARTLGSGAMTNSIADIDEAELILVIGADVTENHAMIGARILRAQARGATLIVVDPRKTRLARLADIHLQLRLGSNIALLNGLLQIILANGWENRAFLAARCEDIQPLRQHLAGLSVEQTSTQTGISVAELEQVAYLFSHAKSAFTAYGMGITQFQSGTNNVIAVSNLARACGQVGRPGTGINPLRGQNNVQGACDMGCLPNVYPGYQDAADAAVRAKFAAAWGRPQPVHPGLTSLGMTKAALAGELRALMIMGEEPVLTDPDQGHVGRAPGLPGYGLERCRSGVRRDGWVDADLFRHDLRGAGPPARPAMAVRCRAPARLAAAAWPGFSHRSRAAAAGESGRARRMPGRRLHIRFHHPPSAFPLRRRFDDPQVAAA